MIQKEKFFAEYNIDDTVLADSGLSWEELQKIAEEYEKISELMHDIGKDFIDKYLYEIEKAGIHSYRYRTKETSHLLEKIVRKKNSSPEKYADINHTNYYKYITDLIGIRVFFLYREDWEHFHKYITNMFENNPDLYIEDRLSDFDDDDTHNYIAEKPKVYKRAGDSKIYNGSEIEIKSGGIYRSLHYIIKYRGYYVEIQGRTLFEEGWGEVDHDIVYPHHQNDEMLTDFSKLLNRLSGMADEMSSYFRKMKDEIEKND